jgi:hypothetical protein
MSKKTILYILPHYDDEIFVIPKITSDLREGKEILFLFLMNSKKRHEESKKFLNFIGVANKNILVLDKKLHITDGKMHLDIFKIYNEVNSVVKTLGRVDEIICTAYEGGHNDHDVTSLISRKIAEKCNCRLFEFFLYNGEKTRGKNYNVSYPVNLSKAVKYSYTFKNFLSVLVAPVFYISQFRSMLGLWPFLVFKIISNKSLILNELDFEALSNFTLANIPLYERWDRVSYIEFINHKSIFFLYLATQE